LAGFIYFVPNFAKPTVASWADLPKACELSHLDGSPTSRAGNGPGGAYGLFVAVPDSIDVEYRPDDQEWREIRSAELGSESGEVQPGVVTHWIGWMKAATPGPDDLQRERLVEGHPVKLGDGNDWIIPVAGPLGSKLPSTFAAGPGRTLRMQVRQQYRELFAESEKWFTLIRYGGNYTWLEAFNYAVQLLAVNYRIGFFEACFLDLIATDNIWLIADASIGEPDWREQLRLADAVGVEKKAS